MQLKAVYWGPGESGKTTNVRKLGEVYSGELAARGFSVETTEGRTLWADSLHLVYRLEVAGDVVPVVIHLLTCTGQERFLATREHVLLRADGCVFVGDADPERSKENARSFRELQHFTSASVRGGGKPVPLVVQLNKVDLRPRTSKESFARLLGLLPGMVHEACAISGEGVSETFADLLERMLLRHFLGRG
ncbi:MAG: ADP-ribosylation factor-like protein [Promethearchaeota archaeon]